jgi:hypothetical protein
MTWGKLLVIILAKVSSQKSVSDVVTETDGKQHYAVPQTVQNSEEIKREQKEQ